MLLDRNAQETVYQLAEKLIGVSQKGQYRKDILVRNIEQRMKACKLTELEEYLQLADKNNSEYAHMLSSLTIHTTSWFREKPHFEKLEAHLTENIDQYLSETFNCLSAACSTGEEVYSLALLLESVRKKNPKFNYSIDGIDIDPVSIARSQKSIYPKSELKSIEQRYQDLCLSGNGKAANYFTLSKEIRNRCNFSVGSIIPKEFRPTKNYDFIFCRNVLIYFKPDAVGKIIGSLKGSLSKNGILSLGHSEAILNPHDYDLELSWNSSYTKKKKKNTVTRKSDKPQILVVDDSAVVRKILESLFKKHGLDTVMAESAEQAEEQLKLNKIDLISLDLHMPGTDGVTWLKSIRSRGNKIPVVVVTDAHPSEALEVLHVLEKGAQDYLNKKDLNTKERDCIERIKVLLPQEQKKQTAIRRKNSLTKQKLFRPDLILIGASTGGTEALSKMLANFPSNSPPVLVVQHISPNFAGAFAERLASVSGLKKGKSQDGAPLEDGHVYLAEGDYHIGVKEQGDLYKLATSTYAPVNRHRPSVDFLYNSIRKRKSKMAGILLTGMGADGAQGLLELKNAGAITFVQDEKSCVVFGMPREAIKAGADGFVGDLNAIRSECDKFIRERTKD